MQYGFEILITQYQSLIMMLQKRLLRHNYIPNIMIRNLVHVQKNTGGSSYRVAGEITITPHFLLDSYPFSLQIMRGGEEIGGV